MSPGRDASTGAHGRDLRFGRDQDQDKRLHSDREPELADEFHVLEIAGPAPAVAESAPKRTCGGLRVCRGPCVRSMRPVHERQRAPGRV